jgi:hypothetical protein
MLQSEEFSRQTLYHLSHTSSPKFEMHCFFVVVVVVLEFDLRASHLLSRSSYHLSHASSPGVFFSPGQLVVRHLPVYHWANKC